jgi:serine/threonine protein kinase
MVSSRSNSPERFSFESEGFRYEVRGPLLVHADYASLLLAWCTSPGDDTSRQAVVLKKMEVPIGRGGRTRAVEEVQLAQHLEHPGIGQVCRIAGYLGEPYVVMEHTPGAFLGTVVSSASLLERKLSPAFIAYIGAQVANTLHYAHNAKDDHGRPLNIIRRAVTPMTIRIGRNGKVKLTNFDVALSELMGRVPTPLFVLRGNYSYAAPELIRSVAERGAAGLYAPRNLDHRADIFSLGLVLLEMIADQHPLDPPDVLPSSEVSRRATQLVSGMRAEQPAWASVEVLAARLLRFGSEDVERMASSAPAPLQSIIAKALRTNPAERYQSAGELRDDLRSYLDGPRHPFGASEAAAEVKDTLQRASALKRMKAHPVELDVLPWPKASNVE